ncbi:preprotein translocase subunit SecA [bacterium]|nr:preprotein translocase subunit SecA [bacterium]
MDFLAKLFDSNKRDLARLRKVAERINELEQSIKALSEEQIKARIAEIRKEIRDGVERHGVTSKQVDDLLMKHLPEVFAMTREASVRTLGLRNYDVQMIGAIALHEGRIAEQKTGEGKTLGAVPALVLNALTGEGSHLITVNDYLARHGAEWMGPIYRFLGVTVGVLQHDLRGQLRKDVYDCDVVYGTNNEYGFDYLRDNMVVHREQITQGTLNFGIVDECDSILIDEARTPLIISGTSNEDTSMYSRVDKLIRSLEVKEITGEDKPKDLWEQQLAKKIDKDKDKTWDYEYDRKQHTVALTPVGLAKVEKALDDVLQEDEHDPEEGKNLYAYVNTEFAHYVQQAMRAHALYYLDDHYIVKDEQIVIVDEFTGRLMYGRRFGEGLHQAIEAKEGLDVKPESQTLATVTVQNFFRMYNKLAGMTGTAKTEEEEFKKIYGMDVVVVPTNKTIARKDQPDVVYKNVPAKYKAIVEEVRERNKIGQPILVGTTSIDKSEILGRMLQKEGVPCKVLNAKYHEQEAFIVAQAGRFGAVTIATNMAGRGTDIVLGGNPEFVAREQMMKEGRNPEEHDEEMRAIVQQLKPEFDAEAEKVRQAGGLYVIGSERHESRRIDNQLRGRSGRQGDAGESRFFLSLQDDLMKMYGGERVEQLMDMLKIEEDVPIESGMLTRSIENAQKKVEGRHFETRKHILQFDDVMNKQRQVIYGERDRILGGGDLREQTLEFIKAAVDRVVDDNSAAHGRDVDVNEPGIYSDARQNFPLHDLEPEHIKGRSSQEIKDLLFGMVVSRYDDKQREIGEFILRRNNPEISDAEVEAQAFEAGGPSMREIERVISLKAIDEHWIDHLSLLDELRSGVSLRGYGQQDPVVVYAQEAFAEFENLKETIQLDVIRKIFLVRLNVQEQKPEARSSYNVRSENKPVAGAGSGAGGVATQERVKVETTRRAAAKISRNAKCYCGSGKKYKQCHIKLDNGNPPEDWVEQYEQHYGEKPVTE